ncbi:DNA damage-binding protein cmr1 [Trichoderma asperellum]|uniref:DNA damage-binding protein CMR1 n=1 Tax=Trichoderma asperellum TaxID=101201 RepID=A0A6V8R462_TRIAP|nr:DNA damage-binding protein cmr1 [Trichoderma asperellum]
MAPKKESDGLSAFERRRLENIAANKALLSEISVTAKNIIPDKPVSKPSAPRKRTRAEPVLREPRRGTRMSSRLAGVSADDGVLKRKLEVEAEHQAAESKAKRLRSGDDMNLGDIVVDGRKYTSSMDGLKGIFRGAQPGVRTFSDYDIKETTDASLKELRSQMSGLKLYEHWIPNDIKITPQRVYALGFHPTEDKPIVFAGDKEGAMGVFDGSQTAPEVDDDDENIPDPVISAFKVHARTITSFAFSQADANSIYSSSYDSSIRKLDLEKGTSIQVFAPENQYEDLPISALEIPAAEPNMLYFSTLDGSVGRHDTRVPGSLELWTLSDQKIGGFSMHPLHSYLLVTASLDRTMKVWDLRKMDGKGDLKHPSLLGEHESRLSVSHASWSAGGHIATSSYDDTVKIYDCSGASKWKPGQSIDMEPAHTVKHNNQTGRWVTILKPQWQKNPEDGIQKFSIGNMNRFVDVYASDGSQLAQLGGDGISAVPAVAHFHPSKNWVAGGTASGKLCLWQ